VPAGQDRAPHISHHARLQVQPALAALRPPRHRVPPDRGLPLAMGPPLQHAEVDLFELVGELQRQRARAGAGLQDLQSLPELAQELTALLLWREVRDVASA
jgi:hypothetical protein